MIKGSNDWSSQYNVNVTEIKVGDKVLDYDLEGLNRSSPLFFDSGTTFTYFKKDLYELVKSNVVD